ncbi:MAG: hypothetical protein ACRD0G_15050 [Acidimicrobiales bacterium]
MYGRGTVPGVGGAAALAVTGFPNLALALLGVTLLVVGVLFVRAAAIRRTRALRSATTRLTVAGAQPASGRH